jgi:hypothetical protein
LVNIVVDVAFKLSIFNFEYVEILFELLNIVVDVAFKLLILKVDLEDDLFELLLLMLRLHVEN